MRSPFRYFHCPSQARQVIRIEPLAPAKPPMGAACNGCGVCCLAEPCPLGALLSRSRSGPCKALQWVEPAGQYRCGALEGVQQWPRLRRFKNRLVMRWIGAGVGCDCDLETTHG